MVVAVLLGVACCPAAAWACWVVVVVVACRSFRPETLTRAVKRQRPHAANSDDEVPDCHRILDPIGSRGTLPPHRHPSTTGCSRPRRPALSPSPPRRARRPRMCPAKLHPWIAIWYIMLNWLSAVPGCITTSHSAAVSFSTNASTTT